MPNSHVIRVRTRQNTFRPLPATLPFSSNTTRVWETWWRQIPARSGWLATNLIAAPDPGSTETFKTTRFDVWTLKRITTRNRFIKQIDPTAQVAIAGLVQVTPGRLQYLDIVWDSYIGKYGTTIPVDVWNMHIYILAEADKNGNANGIASIALGTDPTLAKRSAATHLNAAGTMSIALLNTTTLAFYGSGCRHVRTWMKEHGQQNKPLILSEFFQPVFTDVSQWHTISLDEFGQQFTIVINDFMDASVSYLKPLPIPVWVIHLTKPLGTAMDVV